ncbi:MAG: Hsp20/alpha crystallin family protein [Thermodesulfovibrionales bacterium]|nr:Hsp20/alpha crystallin family protein [Thermodesulfovibrionales bacterium]
MSVIKWSAVKELDEMRREIDKLFDEFFAPFAQRRIGYLKPKAETITPVVEMYDRGTDLVVRVDLPGVNKEDIDISIMNETLTIKGEFKKPEDVKEESYYIKEKLYGNFSRSLLLPNDVDKDRVTAIMKNGVLELIFAKKEEAKAKEIKIEIK